MTQCKVGECAYSPQICGNHCYVEKTSMITEFNSKTAAMPIKQGNGIQSLQPSRPFQTMADKYPKYYKRVGDLKELDVYAVCQMFPVIDPSGAINHARKKLLVPGVRTGGKPLYQDITEARDTLNRWLELNTDTSTTINT